jgi:hypothetical protein
VAPPGQLGKGGCKKRTALVSRRLVLSTHSRLLHPAQVFVWLHKRLPSLSCYPACACMLGHAYTCREQSVSWVAWEQTQCDVGVAWEWFAIAVKHIEERRAALPCATFRAICAALSVCRQCSSPPVCRRVLQGYMRTNEGPMLCLGLQESAAGGLICIDQCP